MLLGKHEFDKSLPVILSKFQIFFIFGDDRDPSVAFVCDISVFLQIKYKVTTIVIKQF